MSAPDGLDLATARAHARFLGTLHELVNMEHYLVTLAAALDVAEAERDELRQWLATTRDELANSPHLPLHLIAAPDPTGAVGWLASRFSAERNVRVEAERERDELRARLVLAEQARSRPDRYGYGIGLVVHGIARVVGPVYRRWLQRGAR